MRRLHTLTLPTLLMTMLASTSAHAAPWLESAEFSTLENEKAGSCKVDAADLNGDGFIDLVFANTDGTFMGNQASGRTQQAFMNDGFGTFTDVSDSVFGAGVEFTGRAVKLRDIDYDGDIDIILGTIWLSQTQLFLNDGNGNFTNETDPNLPARLAMVGDIEVGDVDDDGDLDLAMTNWGENEFEDDVVNGNSAGGVTLLWSQSGDPAEYGDPGSAMFEDLTATNMPSDELRMAWDLEFIDIDNNYALDVLISCKFCSPDKSLWLLMNDGAGAFTKASISNVQSPNGLIADSNDVEVIDLDGDKFLDAIVLHDGLNSRNRVILNDKNGGFLAGDNLWPTLENPKSQDYMAGFYDFDSDKDPDLVVGALKTIDQMNPSPDRLMVNEAGVFTQWGPDNIPKNQALAETVPTSGTCAIVLADLTGDHKLDVAMGQFDNATDKVVYFATDEVAPDTAPPIIGIYQKVPDPLIYNMDDPTTVTVRLRAHDNKSPLMIHDFQADGVPYMEHWITDPNPDPDANPGTKTLGQWYGEYLWRITFDVPDADNFWYRYCAIDAAGNKACTPVEMTIIVCVGPNCPVDTETETDTATDTIDTDPTLTEPTLTEPTNPNTDSESNTDTQPTTNGFDVDTDSDSNTISESDSMSESETNTDTSSQLDDDGCGCNTDDGPSGALASLALLGLLGIRRRRR